MIAPSLISVRRFAPPLRHRLTLALAAAWEALTETHQRQAAEFMRSLHGHMEADEALQRYFREVAVPALMQETVRARALLAVAQESPDADDEPAADSPSFLRVDLLLEALRRRAQAVERVNLAVRLAAAVADEAVTTTHVLNALAVAEVLAPSQPLDEALAFYIRAYDLPAVQAQVVFQRGLAQMARRSPLISPAEPASVPAAPSWGARPTARSASSPALGLRAIG